MNGKENYLNQHFSYPFRYAQPEKTTRMEKSLPKNDLELHQAFAIILSIKTFSKLRELIKELRYTPRSSQGVKKSVV